MISVYYEITVGLCIKSYQLCLGDIEGLEDKLGIEIGHHVKVKDKKNTKNQENKHGTMWGHQEVR